MELELKLYNRKPASQPLDVVRGTTKTGDDGGVEAFQSGIYLIPRSCNCFFSDELRFTSSPRTNALKEPKDHHSKRYKEKGTISNQMVLSSDGL